MKLLVVIKGPGGMGGSAPQFPSRDGMFNYASRVGTTDLYVAVIDVIAAQEIEEEKQP